MCSTSTPALGPTARVRRVIPRAGAPRMSVKVPSTMNGRKSSRGARGGPDKGSEPAVAREGDATDFQRLNAANMSNVRSVFHADGIPRVVTRKVGTVVTNGQHRQAASTLGH